MKASKLVMTALLVPAAAVTQIAPPATSAVKTRLELLTANVARIGADGEKERWNANVSMWKIVFAKAGKLSAADVQSLDASLQTIRGNVANIARSAERERWQANIRLWQAFVGKRAMAAATPGAAMPCCAQPGTPMSGMSMSGAPMAGMPMSMPMSGARLATDAAYGRMKLNVAAIADSTEKERWSANCDLWEAVLAPAP